GAAAGLAAAFNTPLGGIVYAIEELGVTHFHRVRMALISAVIVSGVFAQWWLGSYLYLGYPVLTPITFSILPSAVLMGLISGFLGAAFGKVLARASQLRQNILNPQFFGIVSLVMGLVMAGLIQMDLRAHGAGVEVITGFLFRDEHASGYLVILRWVASTVSYLSGAAGGIFSPALAIGASLGSFLSTHIAPEYPHLMVLLGMIGFLTGVARTPFTSFILVLEMTDRHSAIFPMMMAALAAQSGALFIDDRSCYEYMKKRFVVHAPSH
ncbi:MAG: chloride channel protein, partial [Bdellovibrio sp.]